MTTDPQDLNRVLDRYCPPAGAADELLDAGGRIRPAWAPLIGLLAGQSPDQIARRFARGDQYLHDAGVHYRHYSGTASAERDWPLSHVPVVIEAREWATLERGLIHRAELLEQVMADLYGPADLIVQGLLPPQLVAQNPEWLRPMVGVKPVSGHYLHHLAFEIGRAPDGRWFVLGDRAQAPSGAGFALENRMATARVFSDLFPQAQVARLGGFFDDLRRMMGDGPGHAAILTPGPRTDTYFEHAYIARHLGLLLLEGEDLRVQDGQVMVRMVGGPEPVRSLWRRLDSRFADPLELYQGSALGTPGLVGALRAQALSMVNALGSGVIEARALMAFLPAISQALTGQPLALPNIATWWCGAPQARDHVLAHLPRMMLGSALSPSLPFDPGPTPDPDQIIHQGAAFVGQEAVTLSTTPAMIDARLQPRPMLVRAFAVRGANGWSVMPGGYARIGRAPDVAALALQQGGSVADVWVVGDAPTQRSATPVSPARTGDPLPSRAADNLYWLGRYTERVGAQLRTARAFHLRWAETGGRWTPLLRHMQGFAGLTVDTSGPAIAGTLLDLIATARGCAAKIRDRFSPDAWLALKDLAHTAEDLAQRVQAGDDAARAMWVLQRKLAGFAGLVHENMYRAHGWRFLTLGRALEHADFVAHVLQVFGQPGAPAGSADLAIELGDSRLSHRHRHGMQATPETVCGLLGLDAGNPQSLLFQLGVIRDRHDALPGARNKGQLSDPARRILRLQTDLQLAAPGDLTETALQEMRNTLAQISDGVTQVYLS